MKLFNYFKTALAVVAGFSCAPSLISGNYSETNAYYTRDEPGNYSPKKSEDGYIHGEFLCGYEDVNYPFSPLNGKKQQKMIFSEKASSQYYCSALVNNAGDYVIQDFGTDFEGTIIHSIELGVFCSDPKTFDAYVQVRTNKNVLAQIGTPEKGVLVDDMGFPELSFYENSDFMPLSLNFEDYLMSPGETLSVYFSDINNDYYVPGMNAHRDLGLLGVKIVYKNVGIPYIKDQSCDTSLALSYVENSNARNYKYLKRIENIDQINDGDSVILVTADTLNESLFDEKEDEVTIAALSNSMEAVGNYLTPFSNFAAKTNVFYSGHYIKNNSFNSYDFFEVHKNGNEFEFEGTLGYLSLNPAPNDTCNYAQFGCDRRTWTLSFDEEYHYACIKNTDDSAHKYFGYDSGNDVFDVFTSLSEQNQIYLYKPVSYTASNVGLRFRAVIKPSIMDEVEGQNAVFGMRVAMGDESNITSGVNVDMEPVRVDATGKFEDPDGPYYQYCAVLENIKQSNWNTKISAQAYISLFDTPVYSFMVTTRSVIDIAKAYLEEYSQLEIIENNFGVLYDIAYSLEA